jgi:sugar/nucleoside kinase (ribokinase family)
VSAIKVNPEELWALTGANDDSALLSLQKFGIENIIFTDKQDVSLLVKDKIYSIQLPILELADTTGVGDIFSATFCCTMLRKKDFLWALSFAGGAAQAALETKNFGIEKVPQKDAIENYGSYFYNMLKYRKL